ncbi:MAG TPA: carotenoid biosynthesis protein [Jatrophihabitantaceae bacterium]|jgi:putative membrane protein
MPNHAANPPVGVLVLASVGLQLAYPLTHGATRDRLTVATVVMVAGASVTHAGVTAGRRGLAGCAVAAGLGFGAELVGVHTGVPFGHYAYADSLGPKVAGVPVLAGLAWTMLAWPAALVARRLAGSLRARVLVGGWALASWDLFLDPQMVAAGHWTWADPTPHLPGVPNVPLSNYAGWLLVATAISLVLQGIPRPADDRWMLGLYLWTYVSSVLALLVFLDLAGAALWGALGMGLVAVPMAVRLCW